MTNQSMNVIYLLIAFGLILMNAFFVAAEFGMVKLRRTRIATLKKTYGVRGKILASVHQHLDAYLSACQLGITLASIGLGWIGEPTVAYYLEPVFIYFNITSPELVTFISFFTAFSIISFLHIVIGELMPKSLAIRQSEKVSIWTAVPLYGFYWLMFPAIWLLNSCSNLLLKIMGLAATNRGEFFHSTDEIKLILSASRLHGELTKEETEILEHTLLFADLKVTEVLRPREEMVMLNARQTIAENLKIMTANKFSRYPVYEKNMQNIIGIIHVKDIFAAMYEGKPIENLHDFLRPILSVSQRLPALDLLRKFREGMPHFALVYKNPETLLGFVTLDNLLHILIGRIKDEFHRTQDDWIKNPDNSLTVRGDCPISSLERALDIHINLNHFKPRPETLTALLMARLGRFPTEHEKIEFREFMAIVQKIRGSRIFSLKIIPKPKETEE